MLSFWGLEKIYEKKWKKLLTGDFKRVRWQQMKNEELVRSSVRAGENKEKLIEF
jgi:hypothetical protein